MTRTEPLYVLYGSQMGNSEQAAQEFCKLAVETWTPQFFEKQGLEPITVEPTHMQLDDFLELKHANYTKLVVIFVSSYGVGQAPLGSYRFRELCEHFTQNAPEQNPAAPPLRSAAASPALPLQGLQYAICGLGDSMYATYLKNPTTIDAGLTAAGAIRIGDLGKADAKKSGDDAQDKVIARWMESAWVPLAKALVAKETKDDENVNVNLQQMQQNTIQLLLKLDPDYTPPKEYQMGSKKGGVMMGLPPFVLVGVGVAIAASAAYFTKA
jgi:sulfite reductase alpha subunit-like flavoprotein